ncbi:MAG: hypothetical protein APR54_12980 [Candidatus Cloacimonas sp. SDB]|nr:MAG: hypothetical protein APR54_12980 [Candidatus Cloacimonas sp. SDB]
MRVTLMFITVSIVFLLTINVLYAVDVFGHVITSDTAENVVGADVTLEGNDQTFQTFTNDSGVFYFQDIYSGFTYTLAIDYDGYDLYIDDNVEVGENNVDLGDIILIEIPYPVTDVIAEENHDGNALITWIEPSNTRLLEFYNLHRFLNGDQDNPENWIEIATDITDTSFIDTSWPVTETGVYRYAVTAIYTNGVEADPGFSNVMDNTTTFPVMFNVTTDNGEDPEGAVVVLTCNDGDPDHIYTATVPSGGVFEIMISWFGVYDLEVSLSGFNTYNLSDIQIFSPITIPVMLTETIMQINLTLERITYNDVLLDWSDSLFINNFNRFEVYRDSILISEITDSTITEYYDYALDDSLYYYYIVAELDSLAPVISNIEHVIITHPPPQNLCICWIHPNFIFQWDEPNFRNRDLLYYNVYRDDEIIATVTGTFYLEAPPAIWSYYYVTAVYDSAFESGPSNIIENPVETDDFIVSDIHSKLIMNFPNPFNPVTALSYQVSETSVINISVYNIRGQFITNLVDGLKLPGEYTISWNGTDSNGLSVSSGVYYFHLSVDNKTDHIMKCLLIK